jgi:hypothetical protein
LEVGQVIFESVAAFQGNRVCLRLPGTGIGWNGGLPAAGGFAGGLRDKAIFVKFPHVGGVTHTQRQSLRSRLMINHARYALLFLIHFSLLDFDKLISFNRLGKLFVRHTKLPFCNPLKYL